MPKFKPNYKKRDYETNLRIIKQTYQGDRRESAIRRLETSMEYDRVITEMPEFVPKGLETMRINDDELLESALSQVLAISGSFNVDERVTNNRFYINAPYFDRRGTDPFPLFKIDDPRVIEISRAVYGCLEKMGITDYSKDLLNILVRIYKPGDILNFHTDREIFGEEIYGLVLYNGDPSRGLVLKNKRGGCMIDEYPGLVWKLSGEARWDYEHGYSSHFNLADENIVRVSVSFRFFGNSTQIPNKIFE